MLWQCICADSMGEEERRTRVMFTYHVRSGWALFEEIRGFSSLSVNIKKAKYVKVAKLHSGLGTAYLFVWAKMISNFR